MISYWAKLITGKQCKLANMLLRILSNNIYSNKWLSCIHDILIKTGNNDLWINFTLVDNLWIKYSVKNGLTDLFIQKWHSDIEASSMSRFYKIVKNDTDIDFYLQHLSRKYVLSLLQFRLSNHRLPVETGRWFHINYYDRKCHLCSCNTIGDEYHHLFICPFFNELRRKYIPYNYVNNPSKHKMINLFQTRNIPTLVKLSIFCRHVLRKFR